MRATQTTIATLKETPADAEVASHRLMLRAGLVRKLASGLYTWMPLGLKVLRKVESVIREEMNAAGAQELLMPVVQPAELWEESGRWQQYGPELLRIEDRHSRAFCLGPTHEEVITDLVRNIVTSYRQLPANYYQIQTKFRDEIRPRFGIMRAREFTMKDAYSFHLSQQSLQQTYDQMYASYARIFSRLGLDFRAVIADTGSIGGSASHEFHVLAESGEDAIAFSDSGKYAANVEMAEAMAASVPPAASDSLQEVATPGVKTIEQVCEFLKVDACQTVKTLIVEGADEAQPLVALIVRGDHDLNAIKAEKIAAVAAPLTLASDEAIKQALACETGSLGPIGLAIPVIADRSAAIMNGFVCGANKNGVHLVGASWGDSDIEIADIRNAVDGDASPDGDGTLAIKRGIEVGHIFQLGNKYSAAMNASVQNEEGKNQVMTMGCYGIGVSRVVAAAIEQNHDEAGICWPEALAPFSIAIVPMNMQKSEAVANATETLYQQLQELGYDVLLDDRNERPGVKFADLELLGIPHRVVVGDRGLKEEKLEYKARTADDNEMVEIDNILPFLAEKLA